MKRLGRLALGLALAILLLLIPVGCSRIGAPAVSPAPVIRNSPTPHPAAVDPIETVVLLHTNDFHGAVEADQVSSADDTAGVTESGGLLNLASLVEAERARDPERTLLFDAGDTFQGTYLSNQTQGQLVMAAMNLLGYDAWTLGNHELDWGQNVLRQRIAEAEFAVLAANLFDSETGLVWDPVLPFTLLQAGRVKIGVLGLTYPDTPTINRPENVTGLDFRPAVESVLAYLPDIEAQADLVVILSHLGYDGDRALAAAIDGIDVIVGAHSHVFLERPRVVNGTIIVQAGANGQVLGRLELAVDPSSGEIVEYSTEQVLLPVASGGSPPHAEVTGLVETALSEAEQTLRLPIGETAAALEPQRAGEFALGNLVTDAMLAANIDNQHADIAFHNNGGIRAALPKGPVSFGQLYAVLPFDNQLMAMDLTGTQILRILEHSVSSREGALQVAGMAFSFRMGKPPGQRILDATVAGKPLVPDRLYRVITIDYLASGGDGYDAFLEGTNVTYGESEVWVVAKYIRDHSPVSPQVEGRIQRR